MTEGERTRNASRPAILKSWPEVGVQVGWLASGGGGGLILPKAVSPTHGCVAW